MYLAIDGNAVIHHIYNVASRELSLTPGPLFDEMDGKRVLSDKSIDYFDELISKYIRNLLYPLKRYCSKVFVVFDQKKYWRNHFVEWYYSKHEMWDENHFEYKARNNTPEQRERALNVSAFINYVKDVVCVNLDSIEGLHVVKVPMAEGDDVITVLKDVYEDDMVIWSVDTDLVQHVGAKPGGEVIMIAPRQHNRPKRVYVAEKKDANPKGFDILDAEVSKGAVETVVEYLVNYKEYEKVELNPVLTIFKKILSGDKKSDNIPSVHRWKRGDKTMTLTEKAAESLMGQILPAVGEENILRFQEDDVSEAVVSAIKNKYDLNEKQCEIVKNHMDLNKRLILLDKNCIPVSLYDKIKNQIKEKDDGSKFSMKSYEDVMLNSIKTKNK